MRPLAHRLVVLYPNFAFTVLLLHTGALATHQNSLAPLGVKLLASGAGVARIPVPSLFFN